MRATFARLTAWASAWSGSPAAFVLALAAVLIWLATGPFVGWSDTWMLWINTGTTIVTFLMVFLLQAAQSSDTAAIRAQLAELVRAVPEADDALIEPERSVLHEDAPDAR